MFPSQAACELCNLGWVLRERDTADKQGKQNSSSPVSPFFLPFFLFSPQTGLWAYTSVWPQSWLTFQHFVLGCGLSGGRGREDCCLYSQLFSSAISTFSFVGNCLEGTSEQLAGHQQRDIKIIYLQIGGRKMHIRSEVKKRCLAICLGETLSEEMGEKN